MSSKGWRIFSLATLNLASILLVTAFTCTEFGLYYHVLWLAPVAGWTGFAASVFYAVHRYTKWREGCPELNKWVDGANEAGIIALGCFLSTTFVLAFSVELWADTRDIRSLIAGFILSLLFVWGTIRMYLMFKMKWQAGWSAEKMTERRPKKASA